MTTTLYPVLSKRNCHPRDKNIMFYEENHKYVILTEPDTKYTSVTTWIHQHFPKFNADEIIASMMKGKGWKEGHKYWGQTAEQIKTQWNSNAQSVSSAGTDLHYEIECFNNDKKFKFDYANKELYEIYMSDNSRINKVVSPEWQYYLNFIKDTPELKPFRTEWLIYNEDVKISGSVDMIYENPDGTLSIYDWKRVNNVTRINNFNKFAIPPEICHLPDSNFWHYALQLNTYKYIIEQKYGRVVRDLFLVRLHPDSEDKNYELITIPNLSTEMNDLFLERKKQLNSETI